MRSQRLDNVLAAALAVLLNILIGAILIYSFNRPGNAPAPASTEVPLVQAEVVNPVGLKPPDNGRKPAEERAEVVKRQEEARPTPEEQARETERRAEEAKRRAEEEAKRQAQAEAKRQAAEEARRQAAEEARRQAEEAERKLAIEEARRQAAEEARRQAEEAKRQAAEEARRQAAEEARRQAAEEAKRQAVEEARHKAEEAARRQAAEAAKRQAEEAARQQAEEARKVAEARRELQESLEQEAQERLIASEVARYSELMKARVRRVWRVPQSSRPGLSCIVRINLTPAGEVAGVSITQSSGDPAFDDSAVVAVKTAAPLPVPSDPEVMAKFRSFNFKLRREG